MSINIFTQFHSDLLNYLASVKESHKVFVKNSFSSSDDFFFIIEKIIRGESANDFHFSNQDQQSVSIHNHHEIFVNVPLFTINKKVYLKNLTNKDQTTLKLKTELKAEKNLKMTLSVDKHSILISFENDVLKIEQIIKFLHFFARFIVIKDAKTVVLKTSSILLSRFQINKDIIKIFVELIKNSKKNKIYKNSKDHKMVTEKPMYLKINDKKSNKIAKKSSLYDFIDSYGVNFKKKCMIYSKTHKKEGEKQSRVTNNQQAS